MAEIFSGVEEKSSGIGENFPNDEENNTDDEENMSENGEKNTPEIVLKKKVCFLANFAGY